MCYIQSLKVVSVSGDASLERVTAAGAVTIETTSGDVELERSDAASLTISTTSGEVEGSLLTSKNFAVSSSIGRVSVPTSDPAGGPCHRDHHQRRHPSGCAAVTGPAPQRAA